MRSDYKREKEMNVNFLEHVNVTVADPHASAALLCRLFDWKVRWQGDAIDVGRTVHVGTDNCYVAFYNQPNANYLEIDTYSALGQMNHLALVVDDIDTVEKRVADEGLTITSHADYEPGRRFYFDTPDGIEIEIVSYKS